MKGPPLLLSILVLSGCSGAFSFGQRAPPVPPLGSRMITESNGEEIVEPIAPVEPVIMCQARARYFRGTVSIPCADIARQTAP